MATQQRCVFVGNIPYDATEDQLIRICEEVGPVVSFRLVTDRETGKPKGYGFCEYKDEETALSARRNLQGYEINGRQLRVDFAENDKNADKGREQGRGGPGMTTNTGDSQKQVGPTAGILDSGLHPVGLPVAIAAAAVMSEALGAAQVAIKSTQISLDIQQGFGTDPLTMHLSRMSRNQLIDILSELKMLATENKEQARQLLLAAPLLAKAIFQVQLMLGVVTPQMLQMPNIRQASVALKQPSLQDVVQSHQLGVQNLPNLPPLAQKKMQFELMPKSQEGEVHASHPNPQAQNSYPHLSQFPTQTRVQLPTLSQNKYQQHGPTPANSGVSTVPSIHSQHMINMSIRPQIPLTAPPYVKQQAQPLMLQHRGQALPAKMGHNGQLVLPHGNREPSISDSYRDTFQSLPLSLPKKTTLINDDQDTNNHPSKLLKLNDGRSTSYSADVNVSTSAGPQVFGYANHLRETEEASSSAKKASELPSEVESALLQQVMSLTPEQLSSLPPDQRQQVIQLQQMLRPS